MMNKVKAMTVKNGHLFFGAIFIMGVSMFLLPVLISAGIYAADAVWQAVIGGMGHPMGASVKVHSLFFIEYDGISGSTSMVRYIQEGLESIPFWTVMAKASIGVGLLGSLALGMFDFIRKSMHHSSGV